MSNNRRKTDRSDGAGVNIWDAALSEDEVPQPAERSDPAEEFSDVDVLSTFKPMKPASNVDRDDYEVAMTGPAAFMSPAPKKADVKAESAPAPIAGMTETPIGAEAKPKRNMMPVYGALAASLAVAAFLGAQALPTAKASQTAVEAKLQPAAVTSVASLSIASQPIISEEGSQTVAASTEAQPEPSVVAMAKPIEMTKSPIATTPIAAPKVPEAEFTPLQAQANPKPVETSSLSRADCASRFKTVSRGGSINFKSGSAKLLQSSEPVLHFFASVFEQCSKFKIAVAGHTDSVGNDAFNLALSEQRAASVARYLVDLGIPQESLHAVGYGEAAPIAGNNTALRRSRNRRIEFMIYGG
jgi:outer membrane protein OmpA-like peptidoglycan-associated protein